MDVIIRNKVHWIENWIDVNFFYEINFMLLVTQVIFYMFPHGHN